jgi:hypothetical protein
MMAAMLKRYAFVLVVVAIGAPALAQSVRRDGQWEIKTEMNMPGSPINIPPTTTTQCVTPADAADPQKAMPPQGRGGRGNNDCKVSDYKVDGDKVTFLVTCVGAQPMSAKGEFVYLDNAYTGTMNFEMQGRGMMTMKYSGKRLGDCTK